MEQHDQHQDEKVIREGQPIFEKEIPPFLQPLSSIEFHEQARDTVRAESMVNLAIGVTLMHLGGTSVVITDDDLTNFNRQYKTVVTPVGNGFMVEVVCK